MRAPAFLALLLAIALTVYWKAPPEPAGPPSSPETNPSPAPKPAVTFSPGQLLEIQSQVAAADTGGADSGLEKESLAKEQIDTAETWLRDADPAQRAAGAEQLAAYPSRKSEKLLAEALTRDASAEVRATAAQSLQSFRRLSEDSVQRLLALLADPDGDVRLKALYTLEARVSKAGAPARQVQKIRQELQNRAASSQVPEDTRQDIRDFLDP
jgi:hypothetical protein